MWGRVVVVFSKNNLVAVFGELLTLVIDPQLLTGILLICLISALVYLVLWIVYLILRMVYWLIGVNGKVTKTETFRNLDFVDMVRGEPQF